MPVYKGLKVVFVHIPKTAGSGIANRLYTKNLTTNQNSLEYEKHECISDINKYLKRDELLEYFKFAVIRNPFDRLVSWYHYYQDLWLNKKNDNPPCNSEHIKEFLSWDFDEYVGKLKSWQEWDCNTEVACPHYIIAPQYKYIIGRGNVVMVDDLIRFETLENDWKRVSEKIGIIHEALDVVNRTKHKPWLEYYKNPKTVSKVLSIYKEDFEFFNYSKVIPDLSKKSLE